MLRWGIGKPVRAAVLALGLWLGVRYVLPLCLPFVLGGALALAAEPGVKVLCRSGRIPRGAASAAAVTAAFAGLALLTVLVLAFLIRELGLLAGVLPELTASARPVLEQLRGRLDTLTRGVPGSLQPLVQQNVDGLFTGGTALLERIFAWVLGFAGRILGRVPDSALTLGTGVISGVMISARLPRIRRWLDRQIPRERLQTLLDTLKQLRRTLGSWLLAQLRLAGVTLVILLLGFVLLRIPHAPVWAAGICLVDAFPVLGTGTVLLPWGLLCLLRGDPARAVGLGALYIVVCVTRSALEPRILGRHLGLDPLVTLMAIYAGYKLWGIGGMLLAPLAAVTAMQLLSEKKRKN